MIWIRQPLQGMRHRKIGYCQVNSPQLIESAHEYLQAPPIPSRYHFLSCLALLPIQSKPPRYSLRGQSPFPFAGSDPFNGSVQEFPGALSSSRSASHTLIMDWRVTPKRLASLSRDSIIHVGKSTFTRRCSWFGLFIFDKSRSETMSLPSSNFLSRLLAFIQFYLFKPGTPYGDDPDS